MQLRHLETSPNVPKRNYNTCNIFPAKLNKLDIFNNIDVHSLFTLNVSNCNSIYKQLVISSFYLGKVFSNCGCKKLYSLGPRCQIRLPFIPKFVK